MLNLVDNNLASLLLTAQGGALKFTVDQFGTKVGRFFGDGVVGGLTGGRLLRNLKEKSMETRMGSLCAEAREADMLLEALRESIGTQKFNAWFKHGTKLAIDEEHVEFTVPNPFVANWIETHYRPHIAQAIPKGIRGNRRILITIDSSLSSDLRKRQLDTQAEIVTKTTEGRVRSHPPAQPVRLRHKLEDFVVGDCNKLAYSAALSMANSREAPFNPLFVHGGCGLGKTHLLQGICSSAVGMRARGGNLVRRYVTAEQFTNEFITALRQKRIDSFRSKYRRVNLLAIDDVHFLSAKKATQDEFLHTFNALETAGSKIVMASDAHPRGVRQLNEQLMSRFVAGMVVEIHPPDRQTRVRMLRQYARGMKLRVPEDVVSFIAAHIRGSVRELEGALIRLGALAGLDGGKITLNMATETLSDHLARTDSALTLGQIEEAVSSHFGITPADLHSSRRTRTVSGARMVAVFLARRRTQMSYPEIARFMGKNHSSIVLAVQRMERILSEKGEVSWMTPMGPRSVRAEKLIDLLSERIDLGS